MDLYAFKIYMLDVGLLLAMTDLDASVIIDGNRIFTEFKGALKEQYVLQQMIAELGVEPYYYTTANSTGEIDFMLQAPRIGHSGRGESRGKSAGKKSAGFL